MYDAGHMLHLRLSHQAQRKGVKCGDKENAMFDPDLYTTYQSFNEPVNGFAAVKISFRKKAQKMMTMIMMMMMIVVVTKIRRMKRLRH